jgi:ribosomal protein S18 acetylase RimI-like enzyme
MTLSSPAPDRDAGPRWRSMTEADLDGVVEVARLSFPNHPEDRACFANRLELHPQGCFVLGDGAGGVFGYMVAYPWMRGSAPALNALIPALPGNADLIYLHDLALHPDARGGGHTRPVVEQLADQARADGWPALALVAVNDAAAYWGRLGFVEESPPGMAEKLASYGADARYMVRPL